MATVLERNLDTRKAAELHRELIAAGFVIEPWGDGARLALLPSSPYAQLHPFGSAWGRLAEDEAGRA